MKLDLWPAPLRAPCRALGALRPCLAAAVARPSLRSWLACSPSSLARALRAWSRSCRAPRAGGPAWNKQLAVGGLARGPAGLPRWRERPPCGVARSLLAVYVVCGLSVGRLRLPLSCPHPPFHRRLSALRASKLDYRRLKKCAAGGVGVVAPSPRRGFSWFCLSCAVARFVSLAAVSTAPCRAHSD